MDFPEDRSYTKDHEWAREHQQNLVIGITAFAVDQLGDITMVELPAVGSKVTAGEAFGTIESVKSVSDLFAPVSGEITKVNDALEEAPELVNDSPYDKGWLVEIRHSGASDELLSAADYKSLVDAENA